MRLTRSRKPTHEGRLATSQEPSSARQILLIVTFALVLLHLARLFTFPQYWQDLHYLQDIQTSTSTSTSTTTCTIDFAPLSPFHHHHGHNSNTTSPSCPTATFQNKGGVFIFFHLAKAGGTTVRRLFQEEIPSAIVAARPELAPADNKVRKWLTNATEYRSLLVEFHDGSNPSMAKYQGYLQDWRKLASLHDKPLFVFTIVRNPLDYALSFFTYQNVGNGQHKDPRIARRYEHYDGSGRKAQLLREDLVNFTLPSPQCLFFSRGEAATTSEFPVYASKFDPTRECPEIYDTMKKYMDWIGTVETMQKELLPLLTYLTDGDPKIGSSFHKQNPPPETFRKFVQETRADNSTMEALLPVLEGDTILYQRVQQDYSFHSMWSQCMSTADIKPS